VSELTHGSLFSGVGGLDLGLEWAGFETLFQVEANPFCKRVLEKHWPNVQRFSDVREVGQRNLPTPTLLSGGFPCFAAGTFVLTYAGYKPIESLVIGDFVLTHKGRWRKITSTASRMAGSCRLVRGQGMLPTVTTDEHPYYAREKLKRWDPLRGAKGAYRRVFTGPNWVDASCLSKSSFAGQVLPVVDDDPHSAELWWLVGRYLADGWLAENNGKGRVIVCSNYEEAEELRKRIIAAGFNPYPDETRTTVKFNITKKRLYEFLLPFGRYAHGKLLPGWVLSLPPDKAKALLDGYFTGDGSFYRKAGSSGYFRATTVSPALALGIALLSQRGYATVASLSGRDPAPTAVIEGRTARQRYQYRVCLAKVNSQAFVDESYGWKPIRKSEAVHGRTVFNISVAGDESYVANGAIVHNCQDISIAGRKRGIGTSDKPTRRSGLWFEFHRIIRECRPRWVLVENVPNLKNHGADRVVSDMEEAGYVCWPAVVGADVLGAPYQRRRVFVLCRDNSHGHCDIGEDVARGWEVPAECERKVAQAIKGWHHWKHELGAGDARPRGDADEPLADAYARGVRDILGIPDCVDRLKAVGNACTPVIPALIGSFVLRYERRMTELTAESCSNFARN
jgi:hypothetical protein